MCAHPEVLDVAHEHMRAAREGACRWRRPSKQAHVWSAWAFLNIAVGSNAKSSARIPSAEVVFLVFWPWPLGDAPRMSVQRHHHNSSPAP